MFDRRLLHKINSGQCFVLVGSGASAEMGYPSWPKLAQALIDELRGSGKLSDEESYSKYLKNSQLPELLSQAERDYGSRGEMIEAIRRLLHSRPGASHQTYDLLTNWPIACYLTTNWDDEIRLHLHAHKLFFETLQNEKGDLAKIRHDAANYIVKLHSDLDHPQLAVITSADYQRVSTSREWSYFRERLKTIFEMWDVLVIGHSLSDPDLRLILQIAQETANPEHPVFMVTANLTKAEEQEYLERFNIVVHSYRDEDGSHHRLRRLLSLVDKFVKPRRQRFDLHSVAYSPGEIEAVQAIAIYRRLTLGADETARPSTYLAPVILQTMYRMELGSGCIQMQELMTRQPLATVLTAENIRQLVPEVLQALESDGSVYLGDDGALRLTERSNNEAEERGHQREAEEKHTYGQFELDLASRFPAIKPEQQLQLSELLRATLVAVFKQRGLSIANAVFREQSLDQNALTDIFNAISSVATSIADRDLALAFMESAQAFVLEPNDQQKRYLASISQGFFLYHLFGLDPSCTKLRRDVFQHTIWWCDSSILLPLVAAGSASHEYALDLFTRLRGLNAYTLTTRRLLREVTEHLNWANRLLQKEQYDSPAVLAAATQMGSYKQNLFLDGFIRSGAEGGVKDFPEYVRNVAPFGTDEAGIRKLLEKQGVQVMNIDEMEGFQFGDTRQLVELAHEISKARSRTATLRSPLQVEAEAEILLMIRKLQEGSYSPPIPEGEFERSYFLSQSRVLDRIPPSEPISWTPQTLYRYIAALPGEVLDPDLLQRSMLQEYLAAGVVLIDAPRYEQFFGSAINVARTTFQKERDSYLREFADQSPDTIDAAFEATPPLQKPIFVQQMGWNLARAQTKKAEAAEAQVGIARQVAAEAVSEAQHLRQALDADWQRRKAARELQLAAEKRNAKDPKHLRKKLRQAKKRKKK